LEIIRSITFGIPRISQPFHITLYGIHVLLFFFHRIRVIESEIYRGPVPVAEPKIQADGTGMTYMKIPVRLWWKAEPQGFLRIAVGKVFLYDMFYKIL
jgi:hypothetical protein